MQELPNNPYAAPVATAGGGGMVRPGVGPAGRWEIGEVLSQAFEIYKQQWVVLVFAPLVLYIIYFAVSFGLQFPVSLLANEEPTVGAIAMVPVALLQVVVSTWVNAGCLKIYIAAARGQSPEFGDAFKGFDRVIPLFFGFLVFGLAYLLGLVLLVVPGIILMIGCLFFQHYIVDQGSGPVEGMKQSWAATDGHKMQIFLFGLVAFCIVIVGYLACLIGAAVAIPVVMLATAIIYTRLSGTANAAPTGGVPAFAGPGAPPAAGYGPGYGGAPGGGYGPPGGGYNPAGGGGYGPPGGGGYNPPGGGGYNPPGGGGGYNPPGGGGGYGPPGGGGYNPPGGGGGYGPPGGQGR